MRMRKVAAIELYAVPKHLHSLSSDLKVQNLECDWHGTKVSTHGLFEAHVVKERACNLRPCAPTVRDKKLGRFFASV